MLRFKPGAERERGDLAPRAAERRAGESGKEGNSQKTGLTAAKHIQGPDSPLEIFVICAQGVCSFFRTPQRRQESQGERRNHCKGLDFSFGESKPLYFQLGQVDVSDLLLKPGEHFNIFTLFFMTIKIHFKNQRIQGT